MVVEWDPLRPGSLDRLALLVPGQYHVSCSSEPSRPAIKPELNHAWSFNLKNQPVLAFEEQSGADPDKGVKSGRITLQLCPPHNLAEANQLAATSSPNRVPLGPAPRSFGGLPEGAAQELFQIIAEVIVERVKSKGLSVLAKQVQQLVCTDFVSPVQRDQVALPRTCDTLAQVRFDDLAASGKQIVDALVIDFVMLASSQLLAAPQTVSGIDVEVAKTLRLLVETALDQLRNTGEHGTNAAQRILVALAKSATAPPAKGNPPKERVMIQFAFAALHECRLMGRCDPGTIDRMIANAQELFGVQTPDVLKEWHGLGAFIAAGSLVLAPPADTSGAAQLRAVTGMVFDVIELYHPNHTLGSISHAAYWRQKGEGGISGASGIAALRMLRELVDAAAAQDLPRVLSSAGRLIASQFGASVPPEAKETIRKVSAVASAVGSYLAPYTSSQKPSDEELKARREARKRAISALIDAQTARGGRLGDVVFSIGSTLGVAPVHAWSLRDADNKNGWQFGPRLSLGVAVDYHSPARGLGVHFELSPFDLGAYAQLRDQKTDGSTGAKTKDGGVDAVKPAPADVISPSATLGLTFVFKDSDVVFMPAGLTVGYSPKIGNSDAAAFRAAYVGVLAGVYVPIFDFN